MEKLIPIRWSDVEAIGIYLRYNRKKIQDIMGEEWYRLAYCLCGFDQFYETVSLRDTIDDRIANTIDRTWGESKWADAWQEMKHQERPPSAWHDFMSVLAYFFGMDKPDERYHVERIDLSPCFHLFLRRLITSPHINIEIRKDALDAYGMLDTIITMPGLRWPPGVDRMPLRFILTATENEAYPEGEYDLGLDT